LEIFLKKLQVIPPEEVLKIVDALEKLREADNEEYREIIFNAILQFKNWHNFSPKMCAFVLWRFEQHGVDTDGLHIKVNLSTPYLREQLRELTAFQYEYVQRILTPSQRRFWDKIERK
jgi:hypothetical protein